MTREEAKAYFKRHIDLYCVDGISREAEEMAIEALEERKETVTEFADRCKECGREKVLDKIRAEIQAIETGGDCWELAIKEECLGIIDKYIRGE